MAERSETLARRRLRHQRERDRHELRKFVIRLAVLLLVILGLLLAGSLGYAAIEGTSPAFGFLWSLNTITTLGSLPTPPDTGGRVLQVGLELFGIGTLFYGLATVAEFIVTGELSGLLEERHERKMIESFTDHYIICGFGRVGRQVSRDLEAAGAKSVVIDNNPDVRDNAKEANVPYMEDEPADDEVLERAGIKRARAVIACVDSDAENIFITLTAREMRSDILIVARASAEDSEKKLMRAGADRVISPYKTSGAEMARIALHPQVAAALDVADFRMEEIEVTPACEGVGKTVEEVRGQAVIVAVRGKDGELSAQPPPDTEIDAGDLLVAIGSREALEQLEERFQPGSAGSNGGAGSKGAGAGAGSGDGAEGVGARSETG